MTKRVRQSQHRPKRQAARARELADLKRENHRLQAALAGGPVLTPALVEDAHQRMVKDHGGPALSVYPAVACTDCGGTTRRVDLGRVRLDICTVCKHKAKAP